MSNMDASVLAGQSGETIAGGAGTVAMTPVRDLLFGREVVLGGTRGIPVTRTLPNRHRRMVGAWCFVDHFVTPHQQSADAGVGMRVPPHPHTGLQTVTWLVDGEVRHRDSLGSDQLIRPGQLNLMTAGRGIAHAETSPAGPALHGVQLWVALPDADRDVTPDFAHHADLPLLLGAGVAVQVLLGTMSGELGSATSAARTYTPLVGAEVTLDAGTSTRLSLEPEFEYAVLALTSTVEVDGEPLAPGPLLYLGCGRTDLRLGAPPAGQQGRLLLLGGEPFDERIVMWWNFIGRGHEEIVEVRTQWMAELAAPAQGRFGQVRGYEGPPLPAPELPSTRLTPRGRQAT